MGTQCNHMCPYKREAEGDLTDDPERRRRCEDNRERFEDVGLHMWNDIAASQSVLEAPVAERGKERSSPKASGWRVALLIP